MHSKRIIILIGPPGSGKGTQGELLSEKLDLFYLETAKVGEERINRAKEGEYIEADGQKYYFKEQKRLWQTGKLWDPPFVVALVQEKIKFLASEGKGIILAGSPRTVYEGERVVPLLKELYGQENIAVILLDQSEEASIWRNSHRRICELMRHPILYTKDTENLKTCPLDGSPLLERKGLDDPETIKVRLKEYKERTFPLVEIFKKEGLKIIEIDGEKSVADVFGDILKAIG